MMGSGCGLLLAAISDASCWPASRLSVCVWLSHHHDIALHCVQTRSSSVVVVCRSRGVKKSVFPGAVSSKRTLSLKFLSNPDKYWCSFLFAFTKCYRKRLFALVCGTVSLLMLSWVLFIVTFSSCVILHRMS